MATIGAYEIHTAARGPHWIGWVSQPGSPQPDHSIILVAATQEDALSRTRAWAGSIYNPGAPQHAGPDSGIVPSSETSVLPST
jgi:hypothetical protein